MPRLELDHVIYVADATGLEATAARLGGAIGVRSVPGGVHTTFGTCNAILPLARLAYLEVVAVHDPGTAARSPFGSAVAASSAEGGGWLGWAVRTEDPEPLAERLGLPIIPGGRRRPDGVELAWRQVGTDVLTGDPVLPFFLTWDVPPARHPAADGRDDVRILALSMAGAPADRQRLAQWLGLDHGLSCLGGPDDMGEVRDDIGEVRIEWTDPGPGAGLAGVVIQTPSGPVAIA